MKKYSDLLCDWLAELGYTKCFFLAGGNIMHLLNSASEKFECVPFIHEGALGIAADYHNEISNASNKAFALVTAGPGVTNLITALAGSFLESRDLLVIAGQVKSTDLKLEGMRQLGIQEIDGKLATQAFTKRSIRIESPIDETLFKEHVSFGLEGRKGPIFIEVCLDVQAREIEENWPRNHSVKVHERIPQHKDNFAKVEIDWHQHLHQAQRPVLLLGGEISREFVRIKEAALAQLPFPVMTSWNAADRVNANSTNYFGRPNTWGMRYSNILIQQTDLIIALGTRLGLQQTGFNFKEFAPNAKIIHVFSDSSEFLRHLENDRQCIEGSGEEFLDELLSHCSASTYHFEKWMEFCKYVKDLLPLSEDCNKEKRFNAFINPYDFYLNLSELLCEGDVIVPSSSGGSETVAMQSIQQVTRCMIITSSSLASMGYGLPGAIGAALATRKRVFLVEGDGGFLQNVQELGTVMAQGLNLKIFVFCNKGYASIRMTQSNYFSGRYIGCDIDTGVGIPDWEALFRAYSIPCYTFYGFDSSTIDVINGEGPVAFLVNIHPDQTYFPKISSKVTEDAKMVSNPLHEMSPELDSLTKSRVLRYL